VTLFSKVVPRSVTKAQEVPSIEESLSTVKNGRPSSWASARKRIEGDISMK